MNLYVPWFLNKQWHAVTRTELSHSFLLLGKAFFPSLTQLFQESAGLRAHPKPLCLLPASAMGRTGCLWVLWRSKAEQNCWVLMWRVWVHPGYESSCSFWPTVLIETNLFLRCSSLLGLYLFTMQAAAWSCRCLPHSFITWQIRGDLVNRPAESWILPKRDPKSLPFSYCCFLWQGQARTWLSHWLYEFYCCACSSKIQGLRKGILWKLVFFCQGLYTHSLEHKLQGRTSRAAPVWLHWCCCFFRSLHHFVDQGWQMSQPHFSNMFKKHALPWVTCISIY